MRNLITKLFCFHIPSAHIAQEKADKVRRDRCYKDVKQKRDKIRKTLKHGILSAIKRGYLRFKYKPLDSFYISSLEKETISSSLAHKGYTVDFDKQEVMITWEK